MPRPRSIWMHGALALAALALPGCEERETRTVAQVKAEYASRLVEGVDFGLAGRIKARSFDRTTFVLADVQIDDSPERIYHAEFAEMHVSTRQDTIVLEFISITGADAGGGGLTDTPVATTPPIRLPFDVVP